MQFYRSNIDRPNYLIIKKDEWNRIRSHVDPPEEPSSKQKEYIQSLIDKSHAWTSAWPDSVRGQVASFETKQQQQHKADLATVEEGKKKYPKRAIHNAETIKEARRKIFKESCYGKMLLSAFRESKALEERDAQVQFLKELKKKNELVQKQVKEEKFCSFELDKHEEDKKNYEKCTASEMARQNKYMFQKQQEKEAKQKKDQRQADLENTELMQTILDLEVRAEKKVKLLEKEALEQCLVEHKKCKEERIKREAEYNAKIEICRQEKEELNCKIKRVIQEMHTHTEVLPWAKKIYETIKACQDDEKRKYDDLMEKNDKIREHRFAKQENKSKEKEKQDLLRRISIAETNKAIAVYEKQNRCPNINKCFCDRQCILTKCHKDRLKKETNEQDIQERSPPCFGPRNKLLEALKQRQQQPSPWINAKATDDDFARHADQMLRDCKYKKPARRVVHEYLKTNGLASLDIPNY